MNKKESLIFSYKLSIGMIDVNDYVDKLPTEIFDKMSDIKKIMDKMDISKEVKEITVKSFEIAIVLTEKEKGENYTQEDVFKTFSNLMSLTDPSNLISPISINKIDKN